MSADIPANTVCIFAKGSRGCVSGFPNGPYIFVNRHASRSRLGDDRVNHIVTYREQISAVDRAGRFTGREATAILYEHSRPDDYREAHFRDSSRAKMTSKMMLLRDRDRDGRWRRGRRKEGTTARYTVQRKAKPRGKEGDGAAARQKGEKEVTSVVGVENERCLFITNYLNGSDFGGPAGRLTSKWRVR